MVKGAPSSKENVGDLFDRARMAGAHEGPAPPLPGQQRSAGAFTGAARTLAGDTLPLGGSSASRFVMFRCVAGWVLSLTIRAGYLISLGWLEKV